MVTDEDQIAALFAEANPVPSLDVFDPVEPVDLDRLESRSDESRLTTYLETERPEVGIAARWPRLALLAAVPVITVAGMLFLGAGPDRLPTPSTFGALLTTTVPSPNAGLTEPPIDTTDWNTYMSERYGFNMGYPPDWIVEPADHNWTLAEDAPDWGSSGQETFILPNEIIVGAWSVALDPAMRLETSEDVEAWVEQYCDAARMECDRYQAQSTLCLGAEDCYPGLLVPLRHGVHAFLSDGKDRMIVVVIWRADGDPSVQPFGGARRLLQGFLSTMGACYADDRTRCRP